MQTRRQFIQTSAATAVAATTLSACSKKERMSLPKISHTVFFWLKNPDSVEDLNKLIEGLKTLGQIEQVKAIHIGVPASTEQREVVVNSYQVSELLMFENVEDEKIYQSHPTHQAFVENYSHLWQKVEVYDSVAV
ncbi:Dabb family protein [Catenovulum agarivorans]|uniref:Dabb family protein n=1 Tax=Catenovulum agarivorans TaxID=1172192 RepID=UPI0002D446CA|nr:Dabb family protein [Catenovulum agarivorans]